ncbi:hypothetical protein KC717_02275 [Candidatus Dojkabacteria bacterium]|uniref:beta-fructofuranosidase n=1 Tax=Candidatus Dojkabacteria bacterium TaxID=2099670 RepID=A0A955L8C5_9BACT|nr:hypothetical protein [Candidatus Dojkabacteria bacterium]
MTSIKERAFDVLHECTLSFEDTTIFLACPLQVDNYYALWTRDAMVCALGVLYSDDEQLRNYAHQSWSMLQRFQTKRGRLPAYINFLNPQKPHIEYGGWGRIETLDSQLWYVIAAWHLYATSQDPTYITDSALDSYDRALEFLAYRAYQSEGANLVDWPVSSGWDDQMHRRHHVLSLECLRLLAFESVIKLYTAAGLEFQADLYTKRRDLLKETVRETFWLNAEKVKWILSPTSVEKGNGYFSAEQDAAIQYLEKNPPRFFTSYLAPYEITADHLKRFDTYGNILAILAGVPTKEEEQALFDYIEDHKLIKPWPLRVLDPPIQEGDRDFHTFYTRGRNKPFKYQNGGIWPHISGLYIMACIKTGRDQQAKEALDSLRQMLSQPGNTKNKFGFNEYYSGDTGKPGTDGNDHQAWSAAGLLYAEYAVVAGKSIF